MNALIKAFILMCLYPGWVGSPPECLDWSAREDKADVKHDPVQDCEDNGGVDKLYKLWLDSFVCQS
jgi:hypothetical protein